MAYPGNPKAFLQERSRLLGKNFTALGRIIVGEYNQVVEIIQSPQKRGPFLGPAELVPCQFAKNFPLFQSDEDAGGGKLHSHLHNHYWADLVPPAVALIKKQEAVFTGYLKEGLAAVMITCSEETKTMEIQKMTIRYIFHAFLGAPIDPSEVDLIHTLLFAVGNYFSGGMKPFSMLDTCFPSSRTKDIRQIVNLIIKSPLMSDYVPSTETGNQSEEDYAQMIFDVLSIAAVTGTSTLLIEILTGIPENAAIDLDNEKDVMFAVLEATRRSPPVLIVNGILPEAKTMTVNGKEHIIPAGAVVGASIGLASLDPDIFEKPDTFNHHRDNLIKMVVHFNALGYNPVGAGTRQCPGRNVAMKIACDVLTLSRDPEFLK